ncbi:MAG: PAS domain S-box protein [Terriglobales bacterium]|jgi:two-component system NarL family sensor kinase
MRRPIPKAGCYSLAIVAAVAALLLREVLSPLLGVSYPFLTSWAAIILSAWYCGVGASIVCTLVCVVGVWYWFLPYLHSFALQNPRAEISGMAIFSVVSGFIIALGEANRRSRARWARESAERGRIEDELRKAQEQLEYRVEERTAQLNIANQKLSEEAARVRAQAECLDAANDAIFVVGSDGMITYWNKGAERLYGWSSAEAIGQSPHKLLRTEFPVPLAEIAQQRQQGGWQGELVHTKRDGSKVTVASRWTPLKEGNRNLTSWLEINRDITDRKAAEAARQLSAQLMNMQDDERRRIARELHDSAGQTVIALMLNLGQLKKSGNLSPEEARVLAESYALLQNVNSELRAISHLLHPLLLDEIGLGTALEWYVEGFMQRSGIAATLERDSDFGRLNSDLEFAIFRVVQECLNNVHRHSGSSEAAVRLLRSNGEVRLEVQDRGRGIPAEKHVSASGNGAMGVGLRGMRERILQLGGNLSVHSNGGGTTVVATFPITAAAGATNSEMVIA